MAVCNKCGKKYSKWTAPVSAKGVCAECFQNEVEPEMAGAKPAVPVETKPLQANRHGCLTAWLIFVILANAATAISTPLMYDAIKQTTPGASPASIALIAVAGAANIIFALALFRWKKWGFFGFVASSLLAFCINIYVGLGIAPSVLGLVGIVILYWVLNMGDATTRAWTRLE
jgi:hypothetical protein